MFPELYHAHHSLHPEDLPFWLDLADRFPGPILELGCGTGRVLVPMATAGHKVFGMDIAADMLTFLCQNLDSNLQGNVFIFQADFTCFHLALNFGLILLPCNTLSTLQARDRKMLLKCIRNHLLPEGSFVSSMPNPAILRSISSHNQPEVDDVFLSPLNGEPIQVSCSWKCTKSFIIIQWHYDRLLHEGYIDRHSVQVKHYLIEPQVYLDEMYCAGFKSHTVYGDFDRSAFTPQSPYCIILAS